MPTVWRAGTSAVAAAISGVAPGPHPAWPGCLGIDSFFEGLQYLKKNKNKKQPIPHFFSVFSLLKQNRAKQNNLSQAEPALLAYLNYCWNNSSSGIVCKD